MTRLLSILSLLLLFSALTSGTGFILFRAQVQPDGVSLEWDADRESDVNGYEVYRQNGPDNGFDRVVSLSPTAQPAYCYFDRGVLTTPTGQGPLYRLTVRTATGTRSYQATPTPTDDNTMARSWDTIKLMFR